MSDTGKTGRTRLRYKIHWHVLFTHFPVAFFMLSSGFMMLHLFTRRHCFELAAFLSLLAGGGILIPTAASGWLTWKGHYRGMRGKMFLYKIRVALGMIVLSFVLIVIRLLYPPPLDPAWVWIYAAGILLLMIGAMIEGFYGGRLNHR